VTVFPDRGGKGGFTLVELIITIVVLGITLLGLQPVFSHVLASAHRVSELHQGQLLAQEQMSELLADRLHGTGPGYSGLAAMAGTSRIDLGGPVLFERTVAVEGGIFNIDDNSLSCSGSAFANEEYACLIIEVRVAGEERVVARRWTIFAR
jgi:prepilin-type N-terminal cleavage/methylation domain-containing protein